MSEKRSQEEIKKDIINLLDDSKLHSINYICRKINSNWITVNQALGELKKENKVFEKEIGEAKIFGITNLDSYFKLPIDKKEKELCWHIYNEIIQVWKKVKNEIPGQLVMQKIITDATDELELPITKGWYLYGEISLVIPLQDIKEVNFPKKDYPKINENQLNNTIQKITLDYAKCKSNNEIIKKHYKRAPELYKLKLKITKILAFHKDKTDELNKLLSRFLFYAPSEEGAESIVKAIYDFVVLVGKIILIKKFSEEEINLDIKITFEKLWDLIASYIFFGQTLNSFKLKRYGEENQLKEYFADIINIKRNDFSLMFDSLKQKYASAIAKENVDFHDRPKSEIALAFSNLD